MTRPVPMRSLQRSAVARWMASRVPSSVGNGWAPRESTRAGPPAGEVPIREVSEQAQAIQGSQALGLDERTRDACLDDPPLPERAGLPEHLAKEDGRVDVGDHR